MDNKRLEVLESGLKRLETYRKVIEAIQGGMSESQAVQKYGVDKIKFRNWIREDYKKSQGVDKSYGDDSLFFNWADRLLYRLTGKKDCYVHDDFEKSWEYVKSTLSERDALIVELRYKDELTLDEVGKRLGVSRSVVGKHEERILRCLRHPSRLNLLIYGEDYISSLKTIEEEVKQEHKARLDALVEKRKNEVLDREIKGIPIEDLDLSCRCYTCLKRAGLHTVESIIDYGKSNDFYRIRNFGIGCFNELSTLFAEKYGLVGVIHFKKR